MRISDWSSDVCSSDLEAVVARQAPQLGARLLDAAGKDGTGFGTQHDVLHHRHGVHQHEVLMHHADAGGDGVARRADRHRPPVDEDLAAVGLVEAVEDAHQRRLAAPFSPTMPWMVPAFTARQTSRFACTAPKALLMWRSSMASGVSSAERPREISVVEATENPAGRPAPATPREAGQAA